MVTRASVLDLIRSEHKRISDLFNQILKEVKNEKKIKALYGDLRREISRHSLIEEEMLDPLLKKNPAAETFLRISTVQHGVIDKLVSRLDTTPFHSPHWESVFKNLRETMLTHMRHEESEVAMLIPAKTMRDIPAYLRIA